MSRQENSLLRQKIDALVRRVFVSSSEQVDRKQLELLLQLVASVTPAEPTAVITPKTEVKVQPPFTPAVVALACLRFRSGAGSES